MGVLKNRTLILLLAMVFVGGVVIGGVSVVLAEANPLAALEVTKDAVSPAAAEKKTLPDEPVTAQDTVADIVERAGDAVVKIETVVKSDSANPYFQDPFYRQFFGEQFTIPQQPRVSKGMGSGFIISKDGYILTNQHVVADADEIKVEVVGAEKPFTAEVIGADHDLDLALLKIKADEELPVLALGSSQETKVGERVIAIGNPYGLDHTVTVGVISAKGRPVTIDDRRYKNLLQTDASINPGNSGGPLLNMRGEVVGINTAINAKAQGIGFAIPTSTVKEVLKDLKEKGHVVRPYLGVLMQPVTPELAEYFNLNSTDGALVAYVQSGSPAQAAGIKRGDVILEIDKQKVDSPDKLAELVKQRSIKDKVVLLINRQGKTVYITATIGERDN